MPFNVITSCSAGIVFIPYEVFPFHKLPQGLNWLDNPKQYESWTILVWNRNSSNWATKTNQAVNLFEFQLKCNFKRQMFLSMLVLFCLNRMYWQTKHSFQDLFIVTFTSIVSTEIILLSLITDCDYRVSKSQGLYLLDNVLCLYPFKFSYKIYMICPKFVS